MHCKKSVRIRSYSGPYFSAFGLNTEIYSISLRIQSECGRMRTRITPDTDTFYAVMVDFLPLLFCESPASVKGNSIKEIRTFRTKIYQKPQGITVSNYEEVAKIFLYLTFSKVSKEKIDIWHPFLVSSF